MKRLRLLSLLAVSWLTVSCGDMARFMVSPHSSASASQALPAISVAVTPSVAMLSTSAQQQFSATVTGNSDEVVIWSLAGAGCAGISCGSITGTGLYSAPSTVPNPATVTVIATSLADSTKTGSATVTITAPLPTAVSVFPATVQLGAGAQQQFQATVSGTTNHAVTWNATGAGCSGYTCGIITSQGLYTAPSTSSTPLMVTITATSVEDASKSGTATVTIQSSSNPAIIISPSAVQLSAGSQQQFSVSFGGTGNQTLNWSVSGISCNGTSCGTITSLGLYSAPAVVTATTTVTVTATSATVPSLSGSAIVTLVPMSGVLVAVSPPMTNVAVGAKQQFTAIVTGTTDDVVLWSLSGAGCVGLSCGSITSAGLYTAPATPPSPNVVNVTATSYANATRSASATVTIGTVSGVTIAIAPISAQVKLAAQQQFSATVLGTTNTAVSWMIGGPDCLVTSCGTISSSGLYTAPTSLPNPASVTVTATSQAEPTQSASAVVTLLAPAGSNNSKLNGQYAFLFTGFDSLGEYHAAGAFTADGAGNVTNGIEDINRIAGPINSLAFSGTYSVGADSRGVLNLTNSLGSSTFTFALGLNGTTGRLIEFDNSEVHGSGVIALQNSSPFSDFSFVGGYSVSLGGTDFAGGRIGSLASIFPTGTGIIAGSSMDVNDNGNVSPTFSSFSGTYQIEANGRGTATLNVPGFAGGVFNFALYIVSTKQAFLVSTDPISPSNPILSGQALQQSGIPFTNSSFQGFSVFHQTGLSGGLADVSVGQMSFDGKGSVSIQFDENDGGSVTVAGLVSGGYQVAANGRVSLNLVNGQTQVPSSLIFYAISQNTGFLLDQGPSVKIGKVELQAVLAPFSNFDLAGTFAFSADSIAVSSVPLVSGEASFSGGGLSGNEDRNQSSATTANMPLTGTYSVSQVSDNGRGVMTLTSPAPASVVFWLVTFSEFVAIDLDSTAVAPAVVIFEQ